MKNRIDLIDNNYSFKHGESYTRLYKIWGGIKSRCLNKNYKNYLYYGKKGITICDEWLEFIPFMEWSLNNDYTNNLVIDRKDNNKGYFPENCRWITVKESNRNRKCVKLSLKIANEIRILHKTGNYTQQQLANKYSISRRTIGFIVNNERWI